MLPLEFVKFLRRMELGEYEAKTYSALVAHGPLSPSEVAERSKISQSKIYEVLRCLRSKKMIEFWGSKPNLYKAIDPEIAFSRFIKGKEVEVDFLKRGAAIFSSSIKAKDSGHFWVGSGFDLFMSKIAEIAERAEERVSMTTLMFDRTDKLDSAISDASRRGVLIEVLTQIPFYNGSATRADWYENRGARIKGVELPLNFLAVSESESCLMVNNDEFLFSRRGALTELLREHFDTLWRRGKEKHAIEEVS
ncbi:MAG TPA: helix-turn-helix domain-containing protein [archaeon]|nr:helix-turn-helix domain-containing protein [archaeon]